MRPERRGWVSLICIGGRSNHGRASAQTSEARLFFYLKKKDVDFIPTGKLRWWLLGLIVLGWAVEQYEALKNGAMLVYILADFDKSLVQWGYVAALQVWSIA